jgi:hypothetical protein
MQTASLWRASADQVGTKQSRAQIRRYSSIWVVYRSIELLSLGMTYLVAMRYREKSYPPSAIAEAMASISGLSTRFGAR